MLENKFERSQNINNLWVDPFQGIILCYIAENLKITEEFL